MRIVYFGTADFAVPALKAVAEHVTQVVSQPDRPKGRGLNLQPSPVKQAALELGIPAQTPEKSRSLEFLPILEAEQADVFLVAAYGQILSQRVLDIPRCGCINLHGSILPRWRGAAPIQRAIEAGDTESGVTLMQMDKGMDTGDMIKIARTPIGADETAGELYARLSEMAGDLAKEWMPKIVSGKYTRTPQDDAFATHAPKVEKADAELTSDLSAEVAYNRFRAFTPAPGVWMKTTSGIVKVHSARYDTRSGEPGVILDTQYGITLAFGDGSLRLLEVQPEGKRRMSAKEFLNGAQITARMRWLV
ncbi:MAG: methionyl-tRNA formyltransferase [Fimbriimonadaceae bacterium]|nr:methionyl-tRNA formyltransferase [Fimbriimonadaceae bacterium]